MITRRFSPGVTTCGFTLIAIALVAATIHVTMPDYAGVREFARRDNAYPVKGRMIAVEYFGPNLMASIDPVALAAAMRFRAETGTPMRDLVREGMAMHRNQDLTWSQVALAANAPMLIKASMVDGHVDVGILPTGQVTGAIDDLPSVADLLDRIMDEAAATLRRLA